MTWCDKNMLNYDLASCTAHSKNPESILWKLMKLDKRIACNYQFEQRNNFVHMENIFFGSFFSKNSKLIFWNRIKVKHELVFIFENLNNVKSGTYQKGIFIGRTQEGLNGWNTIYCQNPKIISLIMIFYDYNMKNDLNKMR